MPLNISMMRLVLLIMVITIVFSCKRKSTYNNEIIKIEIARSGAWSDFGATISIDSSLKYKYFGDYRKVKQGYFEGTINSKFWDTINRKFQEVKLKTVDTNDNSHIKDANYFEVIIHWKNNKMRITRVDSEENDSITKVFRC